MELQVAMRRGPRRELIESILTFYIAKLNLSRSRYLLTVLSDSRLLKDRNCLGGVIQANQNVIGMVLDSRLNPRQLVQTIAHEMVHVKQIARGRLQNCIVNNQMVNVWYGQVFTIEDLAYHKRPWELEAFRQERELAYQLWDSMENQSK